MSGVNKAIIVGRLGKDPESKTFQDGTMVCNFSVATSEEWKDKNTGEKKQRTEWHRVTVYRKLAEICAQYLEKGKLVYIEGKLQTREYEKDGQKHYVTEIIAENMQMLGSKGDGAGSGSGAAGAPQSGSTGGGGQYNPGPPMEDDLPF